MQVVGYVPRNSFFHQLDPRIKLLWFIIFTLTALICRTLPVMSLMVICIFLLWIAADVLKEALNFVRRAFILLLIALVTWIVFGAINLDPNGVVLFSIGFLHVENTDIIKALTTTLYIFAMISVFYMIILTTNFSELTRGLSQIGIPFVASFMISLIFQVIPILITEFSTVADAQRSRGLELDQGGLVKRSKSYAAIAFPLLLRCISLGRNMATALHVYQFQAGSPRSTYREYRIRTADLFFCLLMAGYVALSTYIFLYWGR
ncbi:energy-coupling factor transporter transmembrane component T family protein [Pelotomaculum propionicicum]|uniref:Energy-coupling factor transporter transmembrane protein EcfT n=1 Tax=Pelotomaculum propionicicum TaxID=258475 RepID=A0A4Y7RJ54_9FIRM|nr:energy-coupling factor transporter transmembrane component T [Pelotomaculum propionicicum]TEB09015.1 Energy-coupling factor transporter transmembrane protein EcfT [Pelotomaculum propionicicum]